MGGSSATRADAGQRGEDNELRRHAAMRPRVAPSSFPAYPGKSGPFCGMATRVAAAATPPSEIPPYPRVWTALPRWPTPIRLLVLWVSWQGRADSACGYDRARPRKEQGTRRGVSRGSA
jgi:hypothetical protein